MSEFSERLRKLREERKPVKIMVVVSEVCGLPRSAVRK